MTQMDLFEWASRRPSNIIDAVPEIIRRICRASASSDSRTGEVAKVIPLEVRAA